MVSVAKDGIPSGEDGHAIVYSHTIIVSCKNCGESYVERLQHDCFDFEEVWDQYTWYLLNQPDTERLHQIIKDCPDPLSTECSCAIHQNLRGKCESLPTTYWSSGLELDNLHSKNISLSDIFTLEKEG